MLTKRNLGRGKVRVTFSMPAIEGANQLHLVGDFNNWSIAETPMKHEPDGSWTAALTLDAGREYQYRYLANGQNWHNDWQADAYCPNEFGSDNSVVRATLPEAAAASRRRQAKKTA